MMRQFVVDNGEPSRAKSFVYNPCVPLCRLPETQRDKARGLILRVQEIQESLDVGLSHFVSSLPRTLPHEELVKLKQNW